MARGRLQTSGAPLVETGIPQIGVATPAQPVDTFVRPVADTQAAQLATALGKLSPSLASLGTTLQENQNAAQYEAGRNKASELFKAGKDFATAVKNGEISPHQSPFFMAGLNEVSGENAADDFGHALLGAYRVAMADGGSLSTSTNLKDVKDFAVNFATQWQQAHPLTGADPRFVAAYSGKSDAHINAIESDFANGLGQRTQTAAVEAIHTQIRQTMLNELRRGTPATEIVKDFTSQFNFWSTQLGMPGRVVNQTQYAAVVDAAHELSRSTNDMDRHLAAQAIALLDLVPGGAPGSGPLSNQRWAAQYQNQIDGIYDNIRQGDAAAAQAAAADRKQRADALATDIIHTVLRNPYDQSWKQKADQLADLSPEAASAAIGYANTVLNEPTQSNRGLMDQFFRRVYLDDSLTIPEIMRAVRPYGLTRQDAATLIEAYNTRQEQKKGKDPLNDPVFQRLIAQVPGLFTQFLPGAGNTWYAAENHEAAYSVTANLMDAWSREIPKHPEWTDADKLKFYNQQLEVATAMQPEDARPRKGAIGTAAIQPPAFAEQQWHTRAIVSLNEWNLLKSTNWAHPSPQAQRLINRLGPQLQQTPIQEFIEAQSQFVNPSPTPATSK